MLVLAFSMFVSKVVSGACGACGSSGEGDLRGVMDPMGGQQVFWPARELLWKCLAMKEAGRAPGPPQEDVTQKGSMWVNANGQGRRLFHALNQSNSPKLLQCHMKHLIIFPPYAVSGRSLGCSAERLTMTEGGGGSWTDAVALAPADCDIWGLCLMQSAHLEIHHSPKYKCRCEIIPQTSLQAGQEGGKSGSLHCWFLLPPWASIAVISSDTCWKSLLLVWPEPQGTLWTWETTNQLLSEGVSLMHRVVQGLNLWDLGCGKQNKPLDSGAHSQGMEPLFLTSVISQLSGASSGVSSSWVAVRVVH